MAYLDKWKTDFPASVGNETRPTAGIDNTLDFNTDGFPQRIASDPVKYTLENDIGSQLFSNDQRLKEFIDANKKSFDGHLTDASAHANGIAGNAGSATKLATARTIRTNLASTSAASFNGTANVTPGVTGVLPVANGGTGSSSEKYVKLVGDTITGPLNFRCNDTTSKSGDSGYSMNMLNAVGTDGNRYGFIRVTRNSGGTRTLEFANVNNSNVPSGAVVIHTNSTGDASYIEGVTPSFDVTSNELVTAKWVRNFAPAKDGTGASGSWNINSATTTKLDTARTISLSGDGLSATATSFDGSKNISIPVTLVNALLAIAKLTPATDKLPYYTSTSAAGLTTLSSFARTILDDTSASAVRSTIGANAQNCGGIVAQSLTSNGYVKFANGLIVQWGYASTVKSTNYRTANFPVAFKNKPWCCLATLARYDYDTTTTSVHWNDQNTTNSTVQFMLTGESSTASPIYIAIGV